MLEADKKPFTINQAPEVMGKPTDQFITLTAEFPSGYAPSIVIGRRDGLSTIDEAHKWLLGNSYPLVTTVRVTRTATVKIEDNTIAVLSFATEEVKFTCSGSGSDEVSATTYALSEGYQAFIVLTQGGNNNA